VNEEVAGLLAQARENIAEAHCLLQGGFPSGTVSRAYYAIFHTAEALLAARGLDYSSHHAVIAAYGREFARTGALDPEYHRRLRLAFEERQGADYGLTTPPTHAEAAEILNWAEEFLQVALTALASSLSEN
jgi:uncharacterized protein (UPF0332 family)